MQPVKSSFAGLKYGNRSRLPVDSLQLFKKTVNGYEIRGGRLLTFFILPCYAFFATIRLPAKGLICQPGNFY